MIKPLNNHCLIEVINDYEGVIGSEGQQRVQKGVLRDYASSTEHLTASTGHTMTVETIHAVTQFMEKNKGKTVYYEEYSDAGKQFTIDGKAYVLIPFYRLIGIEE